MSVTKLTQSPTEAELEAKIRATIKRVFFNLPEGSIQHQIRFKFNFGHKTIEIDGAQPTSAQSIADVVLFSGDIPLAVLELKRPGVDLREEDGIQGMSYARAMHPSAPLVVVTNGEDCRFLETRTGQPWDAVEVNENLLKKLMESAMKAASSDMEFAVNTLMGTNPDVWMQAIRQTTESTLQELTGELDELTQPFAVDFLIRREATSEVIEKLDEGHNLIFVAGSSLAGKSSVLRDLCIREENSGKRAVLYVNNDGDCSVIQAIVDTLEDSLNWPLQQAEARSWLKRLSRSDGPELILAIDGLSSDSKEIQKEIKELSSKAFGPRLKLVIALDNSVAARLSMDKGRNATTIGRRVQTVELSPLSDVEFENVKSLLKRHRLQFVQGGQFSNEYRQPWIIRSVSAAALSGMSAAASESTVFIAPIPNVNLIKYARERFADEELCELFKSLATASVKESQDDTRHATLKDEFNLTPVIRKKTILQHLDESSVEYLVEYGYLNKIRHYVTDEFVYYVRQPALLASEISKHVKINILDFKYSEDSLRSWLVGAVEHIFLGGIIVAQALWDDGFEKRVLIRRVISWFMAVKPMSHEPKMGKEFTLFHENGLPIRLRMMEKDVFELLVKGQPPKIVRGKYTLSNMVGDFAPWEVLSYLVELEVRAGQKDALLSIEEVLLEIGMAPTAFLIGSKNSKAIKIHEFASGDQVVHYQSGIVEQVTQSLWVFLELDLMRSRVFIDAVVAKGSVPLLCRVHIALLELAKSSRQELSMWAKNMLETLVLPVLEMNAPDLFLQPALAEESICAQPR
ncbi:type I restriction endonuclease [Pseudomonas botevensis]|uniref:type I restriction endonuclease n=1 Tax=Pseudomonas botevensis TaxID=2842352 RepID=UPI001C3D0BF6|nr:type I restriction endonuclease [Pseudomonas botevensis]MBV4474790.1 type I restriction enzyme HsdR N-terminal domain-containing protein [Pseudomonas botevensis]